MGGGASLKNVGPYLSQALSLPVHILYARAGVESDWLRGRQSVGGLRQRGGPFGVGLEGRMRTMINILPASYRRQQIVRNRAVQWITIIAVVLATGWAWHWLEMREQTHLSQQLEVLSREHAPTQTMLKQVVDMRKQLKELHEQESVAKELETQRNALTLLGVISNTAQKTKGRLRVTKFELNEFSKRR